MNPPYPTNSIPVSNQGSYGYLCNNSNVSSSYNAFPTHNATVSNESVMPPHSDFTTQNETMNNYVGPLSQSMMQVQYASVPPTSQLVNNQNQNHPLLPPNSVQGHGMNSLPMSHAGNVSHSQPHWSQPPPQRFVQHSGLLYNQPPPQSSFNASKPVYKNGTARLLPAEQPNSSMQPRYTSQPNIPPPSMQPVMGAPQYTQASTSGPPAPNRMIQPPVQNKRLDPDNMPSPIQVIEDDRNLRSCTFSTAQRGLVPPLVTTNFTVSDEGLCSPRFIRSTIYNVPTTAEMLKQTSVPFALAICPFAKLHKNENPPPIIDCGEEGPVRCHRCRAYMSPFMKFIDAGRRFQCMLCKATSEVPMHYFSHLDHVGERLDKIERPELCLGSYEFIVNRDYCKEGKFPNSPSFIFLIDVSYNAIRNGMVKILCQNMKNVLARLPREDDAGSKITVGFITYSSVVHFYNIKDHLAQPQMLVVSDVQDMFMPLLDGFLVCPSKAEQVIDSLMEQIPLIFLESQETEILLGSAIQAGLEALKAAECSGKLFVFHSSLPVADAPGKLKNREDRKLLGTDKEKTILSPQTTFYNNLAQECVKSGCSVDLFIFNNAYIDVATLGQICRLTGGQLYKYTYFQSDIDGDRFIEDLQGDIEKSVAFDAVLRVRTSTGIRPTEFNGCFFMSNTTDVELSCITSESSLSIEINYDDKLSEDDNVYIQCAILYTSVSGQRRLRVHNLALNTCTQMSELFRNCELDTFMNIFLKDGVRRVTEETPKQIKEHFISRSAQILACYRRNCAQASSSGQLILPECLKLLPLYINCLIKCDAISGGQEISIDDRSFLMLSVLSMNVSASAAYLYPRLLPLHEINPTSENAKLPVAIRCSVERLKDNGVYLLENGFEMFLWIGLNVDTRWLQDVFGVQSVARIGAENKTYLLELDTPLSQCIRRICSQVQSERPWRIMKMHILHQGDKLEFLFHKLLVEDRTTEHSASYVDFLCHLHKEIRSMLS